MRTFVATVVAVCALASPAAAADSSNFSLKTTRDLVALCASDPDQSLYAEALQSCYGFLAGVAQLHRALVGTGDIKPIACPQYEVTRETLAAVFLDWTRAHPDSLDQPPVESLKRVAAAEWPCRR
jgi:hypothetical protein